MSGRWLGWTFAALAAVAMAPGASHAGDVNAQDSLVGKIVAPGGPDVLNFRGPGLKPIRLRPATPPVAQFDVEFGAHATELSPQARDLIRAHRADFAAKSDDATRFVIAAGGTPDTASGDADRRTSAVRDYIVKEFGVDPSRIEIAAPGTDAADAPADALHVRIAKFAQ